MSTAALLAALPPVPANGVPASVALPPLPARPIEPLTERETIILARIQRGESNRTIGDALGIDENRVKIHLRTIFRKTGARNRTEAALRAAAEAIERVKFGVVQLVVHDGRVVQLEVTERQRFV